MSNIVEFKSKNYNLSAKEILEKALEAGELENIYVFARYKSNPDVIFFTSNILDKHQVTYELQRILHETILFDFDDE